jgi:hypothetical protein
MIKKFKNKERKMKVRFWISVALFVLGLTARKEKKQLKQDILGKNGQRKLYSVSYYSASYAYQEFNSADVMQLRQVLNDIIQMYPAENYGLVLWSHAISLASGKHAIELKSFGKDGSKQMNTLWYVNF